MRNNLILAFLFLTSFICVEASELKPYEIPRTQVVPIKDTTSGRQYELYIKLPEDYFENSKKEYPVIYFTDAVWHIELLSASTEFLLKDAILVGISWQKDIKEDLKSEVGEHVSRFRDYSTRKTNNKEIQEKYQLGQAGNHLSFIRDGVIKHVENNYRTDPDSRTYFGYSLGGEFGAYILLAQPDTFKNYILGSPSLNSDGDIAYFSELGSASKGKPLNANVFVSYGTLESELGEYAESFIQLLKDRNDKSLTLKSVVIDGDHQAAFPMTGVHGVTWLSGIERK